MAVLNKKKSKVSDDIPTSSMADIAFLLLIFFLVTTTFPKDKGLAVVLPEPGEEAQVSQKNKKREYAHMEVLVKLFWSFSKFRSLKCCLSGVIWRSWRF